MMKTLFHSYISAVFNVHGVIEMCFCPQIQTFTWQFYIVNIVKSKRLTHKRIFFKGKFKRVKRRRENQLILHNVMPLSLCKYVIHKY